MSINSKSSSSADSAPSSERSSLSSERSSPSSSSSELSSSSSLSMARSMSSSTASSISMSNSAASSASSPPGPSTPLRDSDSLWASWSTLITRAATAVTVKHGQHVVNAQIDHMCLPCPVVNMVVRSRTNSSAHSLMCASPVAAPPSSVTNTPNGCTRATLPRTTCPTDRCERSWVRVDVRADSSSL